MLPTNVLSFVKKIVSSSGSSPNLEDLVRERSGALASTSTTRGAVQQQQQPKPSQTQAVSPVGNGKDRTLASPGFEGADISHLTKEEISILQKVFEKEQRFEKEEATRSRRQENLRASRPNSCRVCLKSLENGDDYHVCSECQQKVCEDCSSYTQKEESWKCSICRRKQADLQRHRDSKEGEEDTLEMKILPTSATGSGSAIRQHMCLSMPSSSDRTSRSVLDKGRSPARSPADVANVNSRFYPPEEEFADVEDHEGHASPRRMSNYHVENEVVRRKKYRSGAGEHLSDDSLQHRHHHHHHHHHGHHQHSSGNGAVFARNRVHSDDGRFSDSSRQQVVSQTSSPSGSSLEDGCSEGPHEQEPWRRRRSKPKRRTRFQKQRSYHDDLDADLNYRNSAPFQSNIGRSSGSGGEWDKQYMPSWDYHSRGQRQEQLLDVPNHGRISRHHSWDPSITARRHSSSSDVSDVSADLASADHLESFGGHSTETPAKPPRTLRKLSRKKQVDNENDDLDYEYDAELSATVESSPSPEHHPHESRLYFTTTNTTTSTTPTTPMVEGINVRRLSQMNWPGQIQIPIVAIHGAERDRDGGRSLPQIPSPVTSPSASGRLTPVPTPRTRQSKSVDLSPRQQQQLGVTGLSDALARRSTVSDFENIRIVIDDVDSLSQQEKAKAIRRKVTLCRLPIDGGRRTRGFGMRVVGGKMGRTGQLNAYVVWTVPGGQAEKQGIAKGDRILEWGGVTLIGRSFEEVCSILDHSEDRVEVLVEHLDTLPLTPFDDDDMIKFAHRRLSDGPCLDKIVLETDKMALSPTRRKLPKPPVPAPRKVPCGEILLRLFCEDGVNHLKVTVVTARNLTLRNDATPPAVYAKLRLCPNWEKAAYKTVPADPSANPSWNAIFLFEDVTASDLVEKYLEVSLWDAMEEDKRFLGEAVIRVCTVDLDDNAEWFKLFDQQSNLSNRSSSSKSLHGSQFFPDHLQSKRTEFTNSHSLSDDVERDAELDSLGQMVKSTSVDSNLLQPEPWSRFDRRRSSSGSEKDHSDASVHSCPYSFPSSTRKVSIASDSGYIDKPKDRLKSQSFRIVRSQLAIQTPPPVSTNGRMSIADVTDRLMRSRSLKAEKRSVSLVNVIDANDVTASSPGTKKNQKDFLAPPRANKWDSATSFDDDDAGDAEPWSEEHKVPDAEDAPGRLGPGQISPKHYTGILGSNLREIKLGVLMSKGQLEIEIICARGLGHGPSGQPPDTYVKTYLKEGERRLQKKKTTVVRHSTDPEYRQSLHYNASDVSGRTLLVMVWERQKGFDHNHGIGVAHIDLNLLQLNKLTVAWYRLFPMGKVESESNESA